MKYAFVRDQREAFPVDLMCRTLGVGSSGFYAWLKRPKSPRSQKNLRLLVEIKAVHRRSRKTYGSPRIHAELNETGHACSRYRVARLMRQHGIVSKHKKKFRITTNSVHSFPIAENLLQRRFNVLRPGQCWVSDITYVPTLEGWLYLAGNIGPVSPEGHWLVHGPVDYSATGNRCFQYGHQEWMF